jgi:formylglycine-generating enzyme required for sulfatase activity
VVVFLSEQPVHSVSVNQFAIGVYEVTVGEFRQFVNATGYKTEAEKQGSCYAIYFGDNAGKVPTGVIQAFLKTTSIRLFVSVGTMRRLIPTG